MPGIQVPKDYTSPDVQDRRPGAKPPTMGANLADRVRQMMINVRDDYSSSMKGQKPLQVGPNDASGGLDEDAVKRIHAKIRGMFTEGS